MCCVCGCGEHAHTHARARDHSASVSGTHATRKKIIHKTMPAGIDVPPEVAAVWSKLVAVPPPPSGLGQLVASSILSHSRQSHICEVNPASLQLGNDIVHHINRTAAGSVESYVAVPYRSVRSRPADWPQDAPPIRVVTPSSRSINGPVHNKIGVCNTIIVGADAELSALRATIIHDLPLLMQHASEDALVVMHGIRCNDYVGLRAEYRGPFWIGNLTVPCWQEQLHAAAAKGTVQNPHCRSLGSHAAPLMLDGGDADSGEYLVCMALYQAKFSACSAEQPLLERWTKEQSPQACGVRKEPVVLKSDSKMWASQGWTKRPSLAHLFRRHIRYYGALQCDDEQVCMIFKDEIDEQWVAGLNSTDGLNFIGDPSLVLPRNPVVSQLYTTLSALLQPNSSAFAALRDGTPWVVPRRRGMKSPKPAGAPVANDVFRWPGSCASRIWNLSSLGEEPSCYDGPFGKRFELTASSMTHNLAMTQHKGNWVAIGGRHNSLFDRLDRNSPLYQTMPPEEGQYAAPMPTKGWWRRVAELLDHEHPVWPDRLATAIPLNPLAPHSSIERRLRRALGPVDIARMNNLPVYMLSPGPPRIGLWMMRSSTWRYGSGVNGTPWLTSVGGIDEPVKTPWRDKQLIIDGRHPGCVEKRKPSSTGDFFHLIPGGVCEYDGRLSVVSFEGDLLLFTRSNPAARGSRHVQMTRSTDDGTTWSPFQQVQIDGYAGGGDIYFFAVQVNPAHAGSLVAVFPLVHRMRGCISIAISIDGVRWSRITPLLSCSVYGERTMDQPALPSMVRRGAEVWVYVHEEVPGIMVDRSTSRLAYSHMAKTEKPSSVFRYAFPCTKLANWTQQALQEWERVYEPIKAKFSSECPLADHGAKAMRSSEAACDWKPRGKVASVNPASSSSSQMSSRKRGRRGRSKKAPSK